MSNNRPFQGYRSATHSSPVRIYIKPKLTFQWCVVNPKTNVLRLASDFIGNLLELIVFQVSERNRPLLFKNQYLYSTSLVLISCFYLMKVSPTTKWVWVIVLFICSAAHTWYIQPKGYSQGNWGDQMKHPSVTMLNVVQRWRTELETWELSGSTHQLDVGWPSAHHVMMKITVWNCILPRNIEAGARLYRWLRKRGGESCLWTETGAALNCKLSQYYCLLFIELHFVYGHMKWIATYITCVTYITYWHINQYTWHIIGLV